MKFTEAQLESAIIELLEAEGYPHVLGEAIERQPQEVLIKADLRAFLAKQYAADHITPQEIEAVIKQLEAYSAADLYESNKAIMKLVSDGFLLKREDRSQKDLSNPDRNPVKLSGYAKNIVQTSKSGQRSRQESRHRVATRRNVGTSPSNRDKYHESASDPMFPKSASVTYSKPPPQPLCACLKIIT